MSENNPFKPAFGSNFYKYVQDQISHSANAFINMEVDENLIQNIKNKIETQFHSLKCLGQFTVNVKKDEYDPTIIRINTEITEIDASWNTTDLVVMNPSNDATHSWISVPGRTGIFCCSRCKISKIEINNIEYSELILAQYDLSCDEGIVKDIIE